MNVRAVVLCFVVCASACGRPPAVVRMATTTSVEDSGLLPEILPAFERETRLKVDVVAAGSGRAITLVRRGDAAVGLTHDPAAEADPVSSGALVGYTKIMFNDFVIAGPPVDAAGVRRASSAPDAFARIAESGALFASRGDGSGTYSREQQLWSHAKRRPLGDRLIDTGQGMGGTLRVASERGAYTLTDRATFERSRSALHLDLLYEGGADLVNTYAIFVRAGLDGSERTNAEALVRWLADGAGRREVTAFSERHGRVFTVWPADAPRHDPADTPALDIAHAR